MEKQTVYSFQRKTPHIIWLWWSAPYGGWSESAFAHEQPLSSTNTHAHVLRAESGLFDLFSAWLRHYFPLWCRLGIRKRQKAVSIRDDSYGNDLTKSLSVQLQTQVYIRCLTCSPKHKPSRLDADIFAKTSKCNTSLLNNLRTAHSRIQILSTASLKDGSCI